MMMSMATSVIGGEVLERSGELSGEECSKLDKNEVKGLQKALQGTELIQETGGSLHATNTHLSG